MYIVKDKKKQEVVLENALSEMLLKNFPSRLQNVFLLQNRTYSEEIHCILLNCHPVKVYVPNAY